MDSEVFRIVITFRKSHSVLLGFPEDELYLISISYNTYLGFPEDTNSTKTPQTLFSHPDTVDLVLGLCFT